MSVSQTGARQAKATQMVRVHRTPAPRMPCSEALARDWMESHVRIMEFWLDRLVADGGSAEFIDTLHRQSKWLGLMLDKARG